MHLLGPWAFLQTKRQLSLPFHILRLVKYPYPFKVILVTSSGVTLHEIKYKHDKPIGTKTICNLLRYKYILFQIKKSDKNFPKNQPTLDPETWLY